MRATLEQKIRQEREDVRTSLMKELQGYEKLGARLYLGEHPSNARDIVRACFGAKGWEYMRDIVSNDGKHISEIHFVRINKVKK